MAAARCAAACASNSQSAAGGYIIRHHIAMAQSGCEGRHCTQYQLLIGYDGAEPITELVAFQPGTVYGISGNEFRHTFAPTSSHFKIQVISKDARESSAESTIAEYQY